MGGQHRQPVHIFVPFMMVVPWAYLSFVYILFGQENVDEIRKKSCNQVAQMDIGEVGYPLLYQCPCTRNIS